MKPWEQKTGESELAYTAFTAYRKMGWKRSIRRAHKLIDEASALSSNIGSFWVWSKKHQWTQRAHAWDAAQSRIEESRLSRELVASRLKTERHRLKGRNLASVHAMAVLQTLAERSVSGLDERQLLASLQAARAAYEIVGLAAIDHADQLRNVTPQASRDSRAIESGPSPEELHDIQVQSSQVQLVSLEAQGLLDSSN
jgi:hypothetical protein